MSTKKRVLKSMGYPLAACAAFAVMNTAVFAETDENQPNMAENQVSETTTANDQQTTTEPSIEETEQQQQQDEIDQINEAIDQRQKLMQKNNAKNLNAPNENNAETNGEDSKDTQLITDRPEQSEEVKTTEGTIADRENQETDLTKKYSVFVDEKTGVYRLTYTISEDAEAEELTIDLTKALNELSYYRIISNAPTLQPGDSRVFEFYITSESGHVYAYKKGSFILTTPEMHADEAETVIAFDGQKVEDAYKGPAKVGIAFKIEPIWKALIASGVKSDWYDAFNTHNLTDKEKEKLTKYWRDQLKDDSLTLEDCVKEVLRDFYAQADNKEYQNFEELMEKSQSFQEDLMEYDMTSDALCTLKVDRSRQFNNMYNHVFRFVYGDSVDIDEATGGLKKSYVVTKTYYDIKDYDTPDGVPVEFTDCVSADSLQGYIGEKVAGALATHNLPADTLVKIYRNGGFNYGFVNEDGEIATASNSSAYAKQYITHTIEYENAEWHEAANELISNATVGEYMKGENSDVWTRVDTYLAELMKSGIYKSEKDARWAAFMMAVNIDGALAGNSWQDTVWGWHNTFKLERVDGEFKLEKVDDKGNPIDATFQLWYYVDVNNDGQYTDGVDDKYFYTTIKDESGKTIPGFVKYDPSNKTLEYTIDTTGGKLDINYKMLEGITYYLQEVLAPKGYNIDSTVYIICDEDSLEAAESMVKQDSNVSGRTYKHAGAIDSQTPLKIQIVNTKETTPPEPGEPEKPTPPEPEEPGEPVAPTPEQPKIEVATGVFVDAQLWISLMGASAVSLAGARRLKRRNRTK